MNPNDGSHECIVHTAMLASLGVAGDIADQVHRRVVAKQRAISFISNSDAAHTPPDTASIQNAVHSNVADAALVLTRMLLSAENRQLLAAAAAAAAAVAILNQAMEPDAIDQEEDQQVAHDAETQAIRQRMFDALRSVACI